MPARQRVHGGCQIRVERPGRPVRHQQRQDVVPAQRGERHGEQTGGRRAAPALPAGGPHHVDEFPPDRVVVVLRQLTEPGRHDDELLVVGAFGQRPVLQEQIEEGPARRVVGVVEQHQRPRLPVPPLEPSVGGGDVVQEGGHQTLLGEVPVVTALVEPLAEQRQRILAVRARREAAPVPVAGGTRTVPLGVLRHDRVRDRLAVPVPLPLALRAVARRVLQPALDRGGPGVPQRVLVPVGEPAGPQQPGVQQTRRVPLLRVVAFPAGDSEQSGSQDRETTPQSGRESAHQLRQNPDEGRRGGGGAVVRGVRQGARLGRHDLDMGQREPVPVVRREVGQDGAAPHAVVARDQDHGQIAVVFPGRTGPLVVCQTGEAGDQRAQQRIPAVEGDVPEERM